VSRGREDGDRRRAVARGLYSSRRFIAGPLLAGSLFPTATYVHRPAGEFVDQPPNCSYAALKKLKNAAPIDPSGGSIRSTRAWICRCDPLAGIVIVFGRRRSEGRGS